MLLAGQGLAGRSARQRHRLRQMEIIPRRKGPPGPMRPMHRVSLGEIPGLGNPHYS
ncbi:hypothetical protein [robinz microvirus RP_87]|nr:hypothetical protein [robinz microvirus RP_87]